MLNKETIRSLGRWYREVLVQPTKNTAIAPKSYVEHKLKIGVHLRAIETLSSGSCAQINITIFVTLSKQTY